MNELVLELDSVPSMNKIWEARHWTARKKMRDDWHMIVRSKVREKNLMLTYYTMTLEYHSRLDPSNVCVAIKMVEDCLVKMKNLTDDSPKYCRGLHTIPNERLPKNKYIFRITSLKPRLKNNEL